MGSVRTVNLELGRPDSDTAIRRLTYELHTAKTLGLAAFKVIHGYGSSGTGGRIRVEARGYLARQKGKGVIRSFIPGEDFSIFNEDTRAAFTRCGELRQDPDLERHNNGITIVVL